MNLLEDEEQQKVRSNGNGRKSTFNAEKKKNVRNELPPPTYHRQSGDYPAPLPLRVAETKNRKRNKEFVNSRVTKSQNERRNITNHRNFIRKEYCYFILAAWMLVEVHAPLKKDKTCIYVDTLASKTMKLQKMLIQLDDVVIKLVADAGAQRSFISEEIMRN